MKQIIQISGAAVTNRRRRLNLFPGRAMSEQAFDFLQDYAEDRLDPLLTGSRPGIVQGLEVSHHVTAADEPGDSTAKVDMLRVNPGLAVSPNGEALSLYFPLQLALESVVLEYRQKNTLSQPVSGLFFLTLHRRTASVDASMDVDACRRTETDPLRDMRLETVTRMGLQLIDASPELLALPREKTANRYLAHYTRNHWADKTSAELPVAMVAVRQDKLVWLDPLAGRYEAVPNAEYKALLTHTLAEFSVARRQTGNNDHWPRLEYLPAAGQLPSDMLVGVDGDEPPGLQWIPDDIQIDMIPLPESRVPAVIQRELPRGLINLRVPQQDRMRLLIAIPDEDFRPDLLDLPSTDYALEKELYRRGKTAHDTWRQWKEQFLALYHLRKKASGANDTSLSPRELETLAIPQATAPPLPVTNPGNRDSRNLSPGERKTLKIPDSQQRGMLLVLNPQGALSGWYNAANFSNNAFFDSLIRKRADLAKRSLLTELPLPWRRGIPLPPPEFTWYDGAQLPMAVAPSDNGLIIRLAETEKRLEELKGDIAESRNIIDRVSDFLLLQRQQLDAQSVSFTTLAGGVSGDGSGMQIARWLPQTEWQQAPRQETETKAKETKADTRNVIPSFSMPLMMYNSPTINTASYNLAGNNYANNIRRAGTTAQNNITPTLQLADFGYLSANNMMKLDQITTPKNPVSSPLFISANNTFGVLQHILPVNQEYNNAFSGLKDLRTSHSGLYEKIKIFIDDLSPESELESDKNTVLALLGERLSESPFPGETISKKSWYLDLRDLLARNAKVVGETGSDKATKSRHLFNTGKVLIDDIEELEILLRSLRTLFRTLNHLVRRTAKKRVTLRAGIAVARRQLYVLDRQRREALSDYALAQQLVMEEWKQVEIRYLERQRILKSHQGLYYVRVRETPLSLGLPDPLSLRFSTDADPVPGCASTDLMVPDELTPFQEAILDIPLRDWRGLTNQWHLLPGRLRIVTLLERRDLRIKSRSDLAATVESSLMTRSSGLRLQTLYRQNRTVLHQLGQATLKPGKSLAEFQKHSSHVLSLEDVLNGPPHRLRKQAEKLRSQLDVATACLLEQLLQLPPSVRLNWAEEAEENRLRVHSPQSWPMLQQAEQRDFDAVRTVIELVQWLFRQLDSDASAASHTALSNLVRACLLEAASDDPGELLQGQLLIAPGRLRLGAILRFRLNREALPGIRLQLFDDSQRVVGTVRIEDEDDQGAVAQVINVWDPNAVLSTNSYAAGFIRLAGK